MISFIDFLLIKQRSRCIQSRPMKHGQLAQQYAKKKLCLEPRDPSEQSIFSLEVDKRRKRDPSSHLKAGKKILGEKNASLF